MKKKHKKKDICGICKRELKLNRPWQKYHSGECRKKANSLLRFKSRKKNISNVLMVKTLREMKTGKRYADTYNKIMNAYDMFENRARYPDAKIIEEISERAKVADKIAGVELKECHPDCTKEKAIKRHEKEIEEQEMTIERLDEYLKKQNPPTNFSKDKLRRWIRTLRHFGVIEETGLARRKEYMFEPLKVWCQTFIEKTPASNIRPFGTSTIFHPVISNKEISDRAIWKKEDSVQLLSLMLNIANDYHKLVIFFDKIGLRMANKIWKKFLRNIEKDTNIHPTTKLYFYLNIVYFHYHISQFPINHIKYWKVKEKRRRGEKKKLDRLTEELSKDKMNKEKWRKLLKALNEFYESGTSVTDDEHFEWKAELDKVFTNALFKHMNVNKDSFRHNLERYNTDFKKMRKKSAIEREKMAHFLTVMRPYELSKATFKYIGNISNEKPSDIEKAHESYVIDPYFSKDEELERKRLLKMKKTMLTDSSTNPPIEGEKIRRQSYFEDHDFLKDFDKELNLLGFDGRHQFYEELHDIALAFEVPNIKGFTKLTS